MRKVRKRSVMRMFALATIMATAAIGLTAPSASALNDFRYGLLQSAQASQRCLDMNGSEPAEGAHGQLWDCKKSSNQLFIIVHVNEGPPGQDELRPMNGMCLKSDGIVGNQVYQQTCQDYSLFQNWYFQPTGEIINSFSGYCLDANGDGKGATVVTRPCNGHISQRWLGF
jgi:hypothetical protein